MTQEKATVEARRSPSENVSGGSLLPGGCNQAGFDPTLAVLFTGDMRKQERKLMSMIGTAVNSLDQLDSIVPAVKALGRDMRKAARRQDACGSKETERMAASDHGGIRGS